MSYGNNAKYTTVTVIHIHIHIYIYRNHNTVSCCNRCVLAKSRAAIAADDSTALRVTGHNTLLASSEQLERVGSPTSHLSAGLGHRSFPKRVRIAAYNRTKTCTIVIGVIVAKWLCEASPCNNFDVSDRDARNTPESVLNVVELWTNCKRYPRPKRIFRKRYRFLIALVKLPG